MSERIIEQVQALQVPQHQLMVVGGACLEVAGIRTARDIDIVVTPEVFRGLRESAGWEDVPGDGRRIAKDGYDVGMVWGGREVADLQANAAVMQGVPFAGLPDVYRWKREAARPKDGPDLAAIRTRLYDRPLDPVFLQRELACLRSCAPAELADHPVLDVVAHGLYTVRTLFGDEADGVVGSYRGSFEDREVTATYHNYAHTADGIKRVVRHMLRANEAARSQDGAIPYSDNDVMAVLAAFSFHDAYLGDGRFSANPTGYDELRSADMVARHLTLAGHTADDLPEKAHRGILATRFNEAIKGQNVDPAQGHVHIQVATAGTDLGRFAEPDAGMDVIRNAAEEIAKRGSAFNRSLTRLVDELNAGLPSAEHIQLRSLADILRIIDGNDELRRDFAASVAGSAKFITAHQFPEGWQLDDRRLRAFHGRFLGRLAAGIRSGRWTATEAARFVDRTSSMVARRSSPPVATS